MSTLGAQAARCGANEIQGSLQVSRPRRRWPNARDVPQRFARESVRRLRRALGLFSAGTTFAAFCVSSIAEQLPLSRLTESPSLSGPSEQAVKISPDGERVGFLRGGDDDRYRQDLWVFERATGATRRLIDARTYGGEQPLSEAEAARRERERIAGTRGIVECQWAPDGRRILFALGGKLYLATLAGDGDPQVRVVASGADLVDPRLSPHGRYVACQRGQNLCVFDLRSGRERRFTRDGRGAIHNGESEFVAKEEMDQPRGYWWSPDGRSLLRCDTSATWIKLHDDLRFLERQPAFVWASDRDGRKQLDLVGLDGRVRHALTAGELQADEVLAVDEEAGVLYVAGDREPSLDQDVWRVRLDGRNADRPERLSEADGWHAASLQEGAGAVKLWVDLCSDPATPPRTDVRDAEGRHLAWIEENRLDERHPYAPYLDHHCLPKFGSLPPDDGTPLEYTITRPPGFEPAHRNPAFFEVYGGPCIQVVQRRWVNPFAQAMAQRGYIVFSVDKRGSSRHGRAFSDVIQGRLGEVEVRDRLAGLRWLKAQPGVDGAKVSLFGWSYGGCMTLMLLSKAPPGSFDAGVAVAPVTRFELYDTHCTERYLGTPQANPDGYRESSVFEALPQLHAPLLPVHGMADDNVLFADSTALMAALQRQGTPFRLMTYPGGKHGLSDRTSSDHVNALIADWFDEQAEGTPDLRPATSNPR